MREEGAHALRLLLLQALLIIIMAATACVISKDFAWSVLVGGGIGFLATTWMILVLLRRSAAQTPDKLLGALYIGELGKYLFVMAFFAIAFKKIVFVREPHNALLMIGTFAVTQLVIWLWPLLTVKVDGRTESRS